MTGYLTTYNGQRQTLPAFLSWNVKRTDGDPCDSFCVRFAHTKELATALDAAVRFSAREKGQTVFTGVVDDYEIRLSGQGLVGEVTGRGLAALLLDNQARAAEYLRAQLEDILSAFVYPCGITQVRAAKMPPVEQFVVETGYSYWQVLAGFCRHSADIFPRVDADGTLILEKEAPGSERTLRQAQCLRAVWSDSRYGVSSHQILVNTRTGRCVTAENTEFIARGGRCVKVHGMTGSKIRATWRTAQQRLEDDRRAKRLLEVRVPEAFYAQPLDRVRVALEEMGIEGTYTVQSAESGCDEGGSYCTLTLRE